MTLLLIVNSCTSIFPTVGNHLTWGQQALSHGTSSELFHVSRPLFPDLALCTCWPEVLFGNVQCPAWKRGQSVLSVDPSQWVDQKHRTVSELLGRSSGCLDWLCQWQSTWKCPAAALNATSAPHPTPTMEAGSTPTVRAEPGGSYPELHARHRGDVILGALSWRLSPGSCLALGVEAGAIHLGSESLCQEPAEISLICWIIVSGSGAEQSRARRTPLPEA